MRLALGLNESFIFQLYTFLAHRPPLKNHFLPLETARFLPV